MSREADYGIVLLARIAAGTGRDPVTARDLAHESRLTLPMVGKILKRLARAHLLSSQRGVRGGYRLARPASEISVADVIAALDGPISLTVCIEHAPGECDRETLCSVRHNWQIINRRVMDTLSSISLAEMTDTVHPGPRATPISSPLRWRSASPASPAPVSTGKETE
jgi:FeS assembly SUF system regulator